MMRELMKKNENQAVRCFLMFYGGNYGITVKKMRDHMRLAGYTSWPHWVDVTTDGQHLTKSDAQEWLRYLFNLEEK